MSDDVIREAAYFIWEREGRPEGCAAEHWARALAEVRETDDNLLGEEEKIMANLPANLPALLTEDVRGG